MFAVSQGQAFDNSGCPGGEGSSAQFSMRLYSGSDRFADTGVVIGLLR